MKTILLLLSISPFLLETANSSTDFSEIKYGERRPHYPSGNGVIYGGPHKYRPNYARHRRPDKQNRRIPDRPVFEIPHGQANQIPYRSSPWLPHKPNLQYPNRDIFVFPERPSPGSGPIIPVPCGEKPKRCPKTGSRDRSHSVIPDRGSAPRNLGSCECGISGPTKMIYQGSEVRPDFKYPWMVAVQYDGNTVCGGAILSEEYILTAANCVSKGSLRFYKPCEMQVAFVTSGNLVSKGEDLTDIIPHPEYDLMIQGMTQKHDIALLKLKVRIQCSEYRRPICLPTHRMEVHVGQEFIIAGWGASKRGIIGGADYNSPFLMETKVELVDIERCSSFLLPRETFHCLQGINNSSPCRSDAGGPMFSEHHKRFYVFGVASQFSSSDCDTSDALVYTKVKNYLDWIKNEMRH